MADGDVVHGGAAQTDFVGVGQTAVVHVFVVNMKVCVETDVEAVDEKRRADNAEAVGGVESADYVKAIAKRRGTAEIRCLGFVFASFLPKTEIGSSEGSGRKLIPPVTITKVITEKLMVGCWYAAVSLSPALVLMEPETAVPSVSSNVRPAICQEMAQDVLDVV